MRACYLLDFLDSFSPEDTKYGKIVRMKKKSFMRILYEVFIGILYEVFIGILCEVVGRERGKSS